MTQPFLAYRQSKVTRAPSRSHPFDSVLELSTQALETDLWTQDFRLESDRLNWGGPLPDLQASLAALLRQYLPRMEMVQGFQAEALAVLLEADVLRNRKQVKRALEDYLEFARRLQI